MTTIGQTIVMRDQMKGGIVQKRERVGHDQYRWHHTRSVAAITGSSSSMVNDYVDDSDHSDGCDSSMYS